VSATESQTTWATNATLEQIAQRLAGEGCILLLTHARPDGDAIGSTLALARTLTSMNKRVTLAYIEPFPERYRSVLGDTPVLLANKETFADPPFDEPDAIDNADEQQGHTLAA